MLFQTAATLRDSTQGQAATARLAVAITAVALAIGPEVNSTPNYANRQAWSKAAIQTPEAPFTMARTMFIAVVLTPPVETDIDGNINASDADLQTAVRAVVDTFAGRT